MSDQGSVIDNRRDSQIRRAPSSSGLYDVLDLILDKGLVVDAFVRVSLVGIELLTIDARIVVASVDTYLRFAEGAERLQIYERNRSSRLQDFVGQAEEKKGKAIGRGAKGVTQAIMGSGDADGDIDEGGGITETLGRGVRSTVGSLVDRFTGRDADDDDDDADQGDDRYERAPARGREPQTSKSPRRASATPPKRPGDRNRAAARKGRAKAGGRK